MDLEKMIKNVASTAWISIAEGKWDLEISYRGKYRYHNTYDTQSKIVFIIGCFRITVIDKNNLDINDAKNNMIVGYTKELRLKYDACSLEINWRENRGENYIDQYPYYPYIVVNDDKKIAFANLVLEIEKI